MARIILAALATLCAVHVQASTVEDTHYVAAVVDYTAPVDDTVTPEKNILNNIEAFEVFVSNASTQGVDIIVFPEEGLKGFAVQSFPMSVPAAEDNVTPCVAPSSPEPLKRLSCMASKYAIYLVVNLVHQVPCTKAQDAKCPTRGYYNYNTNVAFDRKGKIVARYHKYNLFGERDNNVPPTVEYVTFDTDFGVRFGMFICFDILFDKPAAQLARERNVTDFVFSAAWFSEVPFLSAVQAHSAWAHSLDVTLLAAAYNHPATGATGSGIYRGRDGILAYVFNPRTESTMLVSKVPKHGHWRDAAVTPLPELSRLDPLVNYASGAADPYDSVKPLKMIVDHVNDFVTTPLPRLGFGDTQNVDEKLCHNGFCCTFSILFSGTHLHPMSSAAASIHGTSSRARQVAAAAAQEETDPDDVDGLHYRLAVFSGVRDHSGAATTGVQICGIMSCRNESQSTCGPNVPHLNQPTVQWTEFVAAIIHADYDQDTLQFASTQAGPRYDPLPANLYDYDISDWLDNKQRVTIELKKSIVDLRTFAIYGRKFAWDGLPATH